MGAVDNSSTKDEDICGSGTHSGMNGSVYQGIVKGQGISEELYLSGCFEKVMVQ